MIKLDVISDKERGYIFGLFEGDGYRIYDKGSRHYIVEFYLNSERDKQIIAYICSLLNKIGLNPNCYKDKRFNCVRVRVYSKELFNIISKGISLIGKSDDFSLGYVSGFIDSEGYVNKAKFTLEIVNTNRKILYEIRDFLKSLGVNSSISLRNPSIKDKLPSYRIYISVNFKRLMHISIKAGKL